MADTVYMAFDSYDFENNEQFQRGWAAVKSLLNSDAIEKEYLKAKAFFFSKYIQSFDFEKYLTWKRPENEQQPSTNKSIEESVAVCDIDNDNTSREKVQIASADKEREHVIKESDLKAIDGANSDSTLTPCDQSCKSSKAENLPQSQKEAKSSDHLSAENVSSSQRKELKLKEEVLNEEEKEDSLSLEELAVLLQNGLPIPGLISIDVQPTNRDPTPSSMTRIPKPWELENSNEDALIQGINNSAGADS